MTPAGRVSVIVAALFVSACPGNPETGVLFSGVTCTTEGDRVEVRGSASGKVDERMSLSKSGDGAAKLRVDVVDCDDWGYDNDVPGVVTCFREGSSASTGLWSVTYSVTSSASLAAEAVIWNAVMRNGGEITDETSIARVVTLSSAGGCVVTAP
jgi:hypothetical protein